jgi:putative SOS response-associated peptidase YedK
MCGRFNLAGLSWRELWQLLAEGVPPEGWNDDPDGPLIPQRYNVAPTQSIPFIRPAREPGGAMVAGLARWGLVPHWFAKPLKEWKATTINARSETVATAPSFRDAYRHGRCIVPMAGYYEWRTLGGDKEPYYISPAGNEPGFLVAGLWSHARLPDFDGATVTILTEEATGDIANIHDRQPVLMIPESARMWLNGTPLDTIARLPSARHKLAPANRAVGSVRNEGEWLLTPA